MARQAVAYRSRHRCTTCSIYHSPKCDHRADTRWPLSPLVALVAARGTHKAVATALDHSTEAVALAAATGLSDTQADRWAIALGYHPAQVWPDWIDAGLSVTDRQFLATGWRPAWLHDHPDPLPLSSSKKENAA